MNGSNNDKFVIDNGRMRVCLDCGKAYGWIGNEVDERRMFQLCRCESKSGVPDSVKTSEKWERYDFNEELTLCHCCGLEVVSSGSKWSLVLCTECKLQAVDLNQSQGRVIIPIGRHSLQHGIGISPAEEVDSAMIEDFASKATGLWDSLDHLIERQKTMVDENVRSALEAPAPGRFRDPKGHRAWIRLRDLWRDRAEEAAGSSDVLLSEYLILCTRGAVNRSGSLEQAKIDAFERLCDHFRAGGEGGEPEGRELDMPSEEAGTYHIDYLPEPSDPREFRCQVYTLVAKRASVDARYPGGVEEFNEAFGSFSNDDLVIEHAMAYDYLFETLDALHACGLQPVEDFITFDGSSMLRFQFDDEGNALRDELGKLISFPDGTPVDMGVDWLEGFHDPYGTRVRFGENVAPKGIVQADRYI